MKIENIVFAVSIIVFFVLFGGLNGHTSTALICGLGLGFVIGRDWYSSDKTSESDNNH